MIDLVVRPLFHTRSKDLGVRFTICALCLIAFQNSAFGQWMKASGFSNSGSYDQEKGFLAVGDTLFADAGCSGAGTPDSLFFSTDNGQTWNGFAANGGVPLVAAGSTAAPVFIGGAEPPGDNASYQEVLSYSADYGETWDYDTVGWQSPNGSGVPNWLVTVGTTIYLSDDAGGVFEQTAPGAPWAPDDTSSIGFADNVTSVGNLIASGKNLFLCTYGGGILRQTNSTGAWTPVNNGLPSTSTGGWLPASGGFAVSGSSLFAIIDHSDTGIFFSFDIYRTTSDGDSWTKMNSSVQNWNNVYGFVANGSDLYAVSDSGFYASTDNGMTWNQRDEGLLLQARMPHPASRSPANML